MCFKIGPARKCEVRLYKLFQNGVHRKGTVTVLWVINLFLCVQFIGYILENLFGQLQVKH